MVHLPAVMYLDEPTSGLDSKMSLDFCNAMKRLAARNATVLCTIHQPTEEIFNSFKKILVIGDGRCVYAGAPTSALESLRPDPLQCAVVKGLASGGHVRKHGALLASSLLTS